MHPIEGIIVVIASSQRSDKHNECIWKRVRVRVIGSEQERDQEIISQISIRDDLQMTALMN